MTYISTNQIAVVDWKEIHEAAFVKTLPRSGDTVLITTGAEPYLIGLGGRLKGRAYPYEKFDSEHVVCVTDLYFEVDLTSGVVRSDAEALVGCLRFTNEGVLIGALMRDQQFSDDLYYIGVKDSSVVGGYSESGTVDFARWKICTTLHGERVELWQHEAHMVDV